MSIEGLVNIRKAISTLNPRQVREMSERPLTIGLYAESAGAHLRMEDFFLRELTPARRSESSLLLRRVGADTPGATYDISVFDEGIAAPPRALVFQPNRTEQLVRYALKTHPDLGVSLAKSFAPFRGPFVEQVVSNTSRENMLFSLFTALPDVLPSIIELPWAVAEFASDTAFLTMNQVRMAFLLAAASDRDVGYLEQKTEIATVIGSAFGWRALARQLVGKIPFGGGLIAKSAVAYAGTKVLGLSLDRYYAIGYAYSRQERESLYAEAFQQGKRVATRILNFLRPDLAAKLADADAAKAGGNARRAAASFQ